MVTAIILNSSFLLFPTLVKSLNFPIGVLFHADTLTPFPLPALVSPVVVMFDTHQTQDQHMKCDPMYKIYSALYSTKFLEVRG